jgi:hypothetical protein
MYWWLIAVTAVAACSSSGNLAVSSNETAATTEATTDATQPAKLTCNDAIIVVENGRERTVCESTLSAPHVVIDLRDAWTPRPFAPAADGKVATFRATYLALAMERELDGTPLPPRMGLAELYGVVPSFAIVRERFAQQARYACHAKIDSAPIAKLARPYGQEHDGVARVAIQNRMLLGARLERERVARKLPDYTAFAANRELGPVYERWRAADEIYAGITTAQRHLVCEGFMTEKDVDGTLAWKTGMALELFQRRNFLIPNSRLDPETRGLLATDPRELDFRFALRILRERVVDATGLIEDGTAGAGPQKILGRMLDPEVMRGARGHQKPMPGAAPDLVSATTEAAARALGWTTPAAAAAFLTRHPGGARIAIALPAAPAYHSKHMKLSAEIDRGDVWYDEAPMPRISWRRPMLVVYAEEGGKKRPLIRWPTTIGGWSDVRVGGRVVKKWKESDVGPRVWRELYAAPTWLPPASTPDTDLVKWVSRGRWELKRSIMGPGPNTAFGMILLRHQRPYKNTFVDNGIGTHGSAVVTSILNGTSHGCHRLYNQLAVRLGSFLLHHRDHVVKGQQKEFYRRTVHAMGKAYQAKIDTRGFLYELTPPVPVEVLPGTIKSQRKIPPFGAAPAGAD